jgi:hypothetical protein
MSAVDLARGAAARARWMLWALLAVFLLGAAGLGYVAFGLLVVAGVCGVWLTIAGFVRSRRST